MDFLNSSSQEELLQFAKRFQLSPAPAPSAAAAAEPYSEPMVVQQLSVILECARDAEGEPTTYGFDVSLAVRRSLSSLWMRTHPISAGCSRATRSFLYREWRSRVIMPSLSPCSKPTRGVPSPSSSPGR